jgi:hypothetical protein
VATPAPKVVVPIVIAETAWAGTVKSEKSKIADTKVEIFLIEILMKISSF